MSALETVNTFQSSPERPRTPEGVLVPEFLVHDTRVEDVQHSFREPERRDGIGTFFFDLYTMTDGTAYEVMEGVPARQRSAVTIDGTTAWWTQPRGHNALSDLESMRMGFRTRRIGPEIFPEIEGFNIFNPVALYQAVKKGWYINLGYTAHNMHEILDVSDQEHKYEIQRGVSLTAGESRDPMIEPGFNLLGAIREKTRTIAHADSVDPCVPNKITSINPVKMLRTASSEAEAMARTAYHVLRSPDRGEYVRTLDFSPERLIPAITNVRALLNGQAGEMAHLRPKDSPMHLSFMRRSYGNDREIYEEIYAEHPHVHIANRRGAHLDIPRTRRGVTRRHGHIIDQLQQNGDNPFELDFEKVYQLPVSEKAAKTSLRRVA